MALLPQMLERGEGRIVNIASVAATISSPGEAAYDASKAALSVFSEAMAVDLWDSGIKLTIVYPGVVDTELFHLPDNDPFTTPVERIPVADAVAPIIEAVRNEVLELYVPESFGDLAHRKGADPTSWLAGIADYMRQQQAAG
jgi:short-subunit dehydrogenase